MPVVQPRSSWMLPQWLLALDMLGVVALALGLFLYFSPVPPFDGLPSGAARILIALGGVMMLTGAIAIVVLVRRSRRSHL